MYSMFLSIQPQENLPQWASLREYVRLRDAPVPEAEIPRVYLYQNTSGQGRIVPMCAIGELFRPPEEPMRTIVSAEISWPPIGIVFGLRCPEYFGSMADVTNWRDYGFHDTADFLLHVPALRVETDWALGYGTRAQVSAWTEQWGIVWLIAEPGNMDGPTSVSMTVRPTRG